MLPKQSSVCGVTYKYTVCLAEVLCLRRLFLHLEYSQKRQSHISYAQLFLSKYLHRLNVMKEIQLKRQTHTMYLALLQPAAVFTLIIQ